MSLENGYYTIEHTAFNKVIGTYGLLPAHIEAMAETPQVPKPVYCIKLLLQSTPPPIQDYYSITLHGYQLTTANDGTVMIGIESPYPGAGAWSIEAKEDNNYGIVQARSGGGIPINDSGWTLRQNLVGELVHVDPVETSPIDVFPPVHTFTPGQLFKITRVHHPN